VSRTESSTAASRRQGRLPWTRPLSADADASGAGPRHPRRLPAARGGSRPLLELHETEGPTTSTRVVLRPSLALGTALSAVEPPHPPATAHPGDRAPASRRSPVAGGPWPTPATDQGHAPGPRRLTSRPVPPAARSGQQGTPTGRLSRRLRNACGVLEVAP